MEKQKEMVKSRKNAEERKIMETQIAELEKIKRFEKSNEIALAKAEKEQVNKELQDELEREKQKRKDYQDVCQKQYQENIQLKEYMKKQKLKKAKEDIQRKKDLFGDMFEEKRHVSYELAAKNQKKFDALNKILVQENERKNQFRNYAEFEEGVNYLDK